MRDLFFILFQSTPFDTGITVTPFSVFHFVYLAIIAGAILALYFCFKDSSPEKKEKLLNVLVILLLVSYVSDFFVHDFVYAEVVDGAYVGGGLNMDKLPFHVCVVLCPLSALVQFNGRLKKFREPVVMLAALAPIMYLSYPANVGAGEPWCYQTVQTMLYHGTLLAWGILTLALGVLKPNIRRCHTSAILLVAITLWAKLGNILLGHNWFYLEEDAFYIGLVEGGVIPKWSLMIINPVVFFSAVLALYGIYYLIIRIKLNLENVSKA